jgi:hypothetical protein
MVEVAFVIFQGSELAEVARFVVGKSVLARRDRGQNSLSII